MNRQLAIRMVLCCCAIFILFLVVGISIQRIVFPNATFKGMVYLIALPATQPITSYLFWEVYIIRRLPVTYITPVDYPLIFDFLERMCARAGFDPEYLPKVAIVANRGANCFTVGTRPGVAVIVITTGLLELLDREEMEAVLSHELSHIKNMDMFLLILARAWWFITFPLVYKLSRYRELLADEEGSLLTEKPLILARALTKIDRARETSTVEHLNVLNKMKALLIIPHISMTGIKLFHTHPTIEERIERLKVLHLRLSERR